MLIKRVVIQGFKTFAKRTEFLFDPGITAVVGPNGSGKSNIVDAVRWCLGEQSFSLLRSKKSADIIFSGSDKRARLGMAQVSLLLDNAGGEIPIDFAEVEITRRAYRDGDNEYLVNGQRVRLADVTELLAQTGLGKRTYAVIGQGLIDRVLSLAPEERRSLFEEAAGITGYQSKRELALRRLEATQANLTRVRDITAELAPRLTTLRRQAERAREREQMADDLRGLLRDWYGYQWHTAMAAVDDHGADARILRNRLDDRQIELEAAGAAVEALRAQQVALRPTLGEHHRAAGELHREAEEVGRTLAVAQERARQLAERGEDLARELGPLGVEQEALAARLAEAQGGLEAMGGEVDARRAELARTEAALAERRRAAAQLQQGVEGARRALALIQQRQGESAARRTQLAERIQTLAAEAHRREGALAAAQGEAEGAAAQVVEAEASHAALEAEGARLSAALAELERTRTALRSRLDEGERSRRDLDRDLDRLQTRHDLLRRLSSEGQGMASGVRAVLQSNLPGVLGPVASLLHVRPEHERAVEVALGGALQNVVTASWAEAQAAIELLKQRRAGRATFLPLDRLQTGSPIRAPRLDGVLGNAADLVGCDPRAAAARDHLLNRTWIVTDLPTARRALDGLRDGPRPTVVTLEGEIVRPGGAVTGGSDGERRDDSVLARERELRELPVRVEQARARAQEAAAACRALAQGLAQAETDAEVQQRALAELARDERTRRSALEEARRRSDRAAQQLRYLAEQQEGGAEEAAGFGRRQRELEESLSTLLGERAQAEAALAAAEGELSRSAADDLLRELADRRAAEAAALGDLNSRIALVAQQERTVQSVAAQVRSKEERRRGLEAEAEELAARTDALIEREGAIRRALAEQQAVIAPEEARLAELAAQQAQAEAVERSLQQAQRGDESAWAHAQLSLQRSEDAVSRLRAEIDRDLGLVSMESSESVAVQQPLPLEAFVDQLPVRESVPEGLAEEMAALRGRLARLVHVNPDAPREYDEAAQRYEYLTAQADDLESAAADLHTIIGELDQVMQTELERTFRQVAIHFREEFAKLFNGGAAELILTEPEAIARSGIEIVARPPGKRPQSLALLSGGERALAACALIFAILRVSPTPFCVLDEVDAALDEANVDRFRLAVEELSEGTQFIVVTHNRRTLEGANTIYGVTMGDDGVSKVISLRLEGERMVQRKPAQGVTPPAEGDPDPGAADLAVLEESVAL